MKTKFYALWSVLLLLHCAAAPAQYMLNNTWENASTGEVSENADWKLNLVSGSIRVVDNEARAGSKSVRFDATGARCELSGEYHATLEEDLWYGYSMKIGALDKATKRAIVTQWHGRPDECDAWRAPVMSWELEENMKNYRFNVHYTQHRISL